MAVSATAVPPAAGVVARVGLGGSGDGRHDRMDDGSARAPACVVLPRASGRLVGDSLSTPTEMLAALRLSPHASVFHDTHMLVDRLRGMDGVAEVAVTRRPPGSLKVIVREVEPVALVANGRGALTVVDGDGRALPFELRSLDLPVVQAADSAVVGVLARVQVFDPALFQAIDAARRIDAQHDVALELGTRRVLLARDAGPEVIQAVMVVARDLAAKQRSYAELDARFAGQVVVRRRALAGATAS